MKTTLKKYPRLAVSIRHLAVTHSPIYPLTAHLGKIIYLADRHWAEKKGFAYTEANWQRWNYGPYSTPLLMTVADMIGLEIVSTPTKFIAGDYSRVDDFEIDTTFVGYLDLYGKKYAYDYEGLTAYTYSRPDFRSKEFGDSLLTTSVGTEAT